MKIQLRENPENILGKEALQYFHKNNLKINNIEFIGEGEYSKTYKIETDKNNYALNIREDEFRKAVYLKLKGQIYEYLPKIYSVYDLPNDYYAVVMELLYPISDEEKKVISHIDRLFYDNDENGLDIWLENNLHYDLYDKVIEYVENTDQPDWFSEEYENYEHLINEIQSAFQEYYEVSGFNYADFHGDNLMKDKKGNYKLIDL